MGHVTGQTDKWEVVATSVPGSSHRKFNLPCQDVVFFRLLSRGTLVASLADGAGSASLAEVGATIAAHVATASMSTAIEKEDFSFGEIELRDVLLEALKRARTSVVEEAEKRGVRPRELATTLIAAVFTETRAGSAQIGDGAVVIGADADSYTLLTGPAQAEHLNETVFLTADNAMEHAQVSIRPGPVRYASLLCDGLQLLALKYPELTPHPGFFTPLFKFLEVLGSGDNTTTQLRQFLESPRVTARSDDDLSLLLAVLRGKPNSNTHKQGSDHTGKGNAVSQR